MFVALGLISTGRDLNMKTKAMISHGDDGGTAFGGTTRVTGRVKRVGAAAPAISVGGMCGDDDARDDAVAIQSIMRSSRRPVQSSDDSFTRMDNTAANICVRSLSIVNTG